MAAKDRRERNAFTRAFKARETVINQLSNCNSYEKLQEIEKGFKKSKSRSQSPFSIINLTVAHTETIKNQDKKIADLLVQKRAQFPFALVKTAVESVITPDEPVTTVVQPVNEGISPANEAIEPINVLTSATRIIHSNGAPSIRQYNPLKREADLPSAEREEQISKVRIALAEMSTKIDALYATSVSYKNKPAKAELYTRAAKAAARIHNSLNLLCEDYVYNKIDMDTFKNESRKYLDEEDANVQELKTHRGFKEVIANLLIAISGVGLIALAVYSAYKGRMTFFPLATDTGNKVSALKDSVEQVQAVSLN